MKLFYFCLIAAALKNTVCLTSSTYANLEIICVDSGTCIKCDKSDMNKGYCKDTGRKMRTSCSDRSGSGQVIDDYRSCAITVQDDQLRVIIFQVIIGMIGAAAFYVVQTRKHITMYDNRKQSRYTATV